MLSAIRTLSLLFSPEHRLTWLWGPSPWRGWNESIYFTHSTQLKTVYSSTWCSSSTDLHTEWHIINWTHISRNSNQHSEACFLLMSLIPASERRISLTFHRKHNICLVHYVAIHQCRKKFEWCSLWQHRRIQSFVGVQHRKILASNLFGKKKTQAKEELDTGNKTTSNRILTRLLMNK